jgi:septum formation protein
MTLVLASASPRRSELLRNAGISFVVEPAHVPEQPLPNERPLVYAQRLACDKARAVFARHPDAVVLGADTIVVADEHLLEKPRDAEDAARMLRLLSGRAHQVVTGVCLMSAGFVQTEAEITEVRFSSLSESEIANYVATGEPMDKAGAYAIQGVASRWVERIDGCYFNVVGLPVPHVYRMLRRLEAETGIRLVE